MDSVFLQIGVATIVAATLGVLARLLRQPIVLAYIVAGILLGAGFGVIHDTNITGDVGTIGIVFLLFLVGLELDIVKLRRLGAVVLVSGLVPVLIVALGGYVIVRGFGWTSLTAAYIGAAAAFSSTAVVLKRLSDRGDLASLYAKISIGILLLQDILAIVALMAISASSQGALGPSGLMLFMLKGACFFVGSWALTRYVLARLFFFIAKSAELLFLASIAYAFLFALGAEALGFSKEIGAFVAGLSLATLPYSLEIMGRVKPLKDFFLVIFFVVLGLEVSPDVVFQNIPLILALSTLVVFVKSFVTAASIIRLGYPKRPAYLVGASLGQMSEFSLLIVLLGQGTGQIPTEVVGITAALLVISIVLNTYWNDLNRIIYPVLVRPLSWFAKSAATKELAAHPTGLSEHTLLFGANRMGDGLVQRLAELGHQVLVVDHNPEVIRRLLARGVPSVYGDIDDYELLHDMGLDRAKLVISTIPNLAANLYLLEQSRKQNRHTTVILTAEQVTDALELYEAGADYVIVPHLLGGEQAAQLLQELSHGSEKLLTERDRHIQHLARRHSLAGAA